MQRIVFVLLAGALLGGCGEHDECKAEERLLESNRKVVIKLNAEKAVSYKKAAMKVMQKSFGGVASTSSMTSSSDNDISLKSQESVFEVVHRSKVVDLSGLLKGGADKDDVEFLLKQVRSAEGDLIEAGFVPIDSYNTVAPKYTSTSGRQVIHDVYTESEWLLRPRSSKTKYHCEAGFPSFKVTRTYFTKRSAATLYLIMTLFPPSKELLVEVLYTDRTRLSSIYGVEGSMRDDLR